VHNISLNKGDDGAKNFVSKEKTTLDEAATARKIDSPFFLGIVLVVNFDVADPLEKKLDEEVLVGSDKVKDLTMLF